MMYHRKYTEFIQYGFNSRYCGVVAPRIGRYCGSIVDGGADCVLSERFVNSADGAVGKGEGWWPTIAAEDDPDEPEISVPYPDLSIEIAGTGSDGYHCHDHNVCWLATASSSWIRLLYIIKPHPYRPIERRLVPSAGIDCRTLRCATDLDRLLRLSMLIGWRW